VKRWERRTKKLINEQARRARAHHLLAESGLPRDERDRILDEIGADTAIRALHNGFGCKVIPRSEIETMLRNHFDVPPGLPRLLEYTKG
jgi:hypothetical protein